MWWLAHLGTTAQLKGDDFESAMKTKTARIVYVYAEVDGFATKEPGGELSGLYAEMIDAFENFALVRYGVVVRGIYHNVGGSALQPFLNALKTGSGGVFGFNTVSINEERKKYVKFSQGVINNISILITNKNVPTLSSMDKIALEFKNLTAYTVPGSTYHNRLLKLKQDVFTDLNIELVPSDYHIVERVLSDDQSFAFIDISYYLEYLRAKKPIKRHAAGDLSGDQYGIVMPMDTDWDIVLEEFLDEYLKSNEHKKAVTRNLGSGALRMLVFPQ